MKLPETSNLQLPDPQIRARNRRKSGQRGRKEPGSWSFAERASCLVGTGLTRISVQTYKYIYNIYIYRDIHLYIYTHIYIYIYTYRLYVYGIITP